MLTLKNKNVLVIGGAGFIGSHLVDKLIEESPTNIIVVDDLFLGKLSNLDTAKLNFPDIRVYERDASDYDAMRGILDKEKVDVVFNFGVLPLPASLVEPRLTCHMNVEIALVLCELSRQSQFGTLVHCSSSEVYGSAQYVPMDESHPLAPATPYAASKAACDHIVLSYALTYGLDTVIVRPFNNFGPRQNDQTYAGIVPEVINRILAGRDVEIYGDGEQTRDLLYVKDTAAATILAYQQPRARGKAINIGSGQEVSINRLVSLIFEVMDASPVRVKHVGARTADVRRHLAGTELAKELLGFRPSSTLEKSISQTVDWYAQKWHRKEKIAARAGR